MWDLQSDFLLKSLQGLRGRVHRDSIFTVEKPGKYYLNQLTSSVIRHVDSRNPWNVIKMVLHLVGLSLKILQSLWNDGETSYKRNWRKICKISDHYACFAKVIKNKENLRNCHSQEKSKYTWLLNATWYPGWDHGMIKKDIKDIK